MGTGSMTVVVHMACVEVAVLAGSMPETTLRMLRRRMKANREVRAMLGLYTCLEDLCAAASFKLCLLCK